MLFRSKRGLDELPYDETDDSYTVIDGPGYEYHDHVPSLLSLIHISIAVRILGILKSCSKRFCRIFISSKFTYEMCIRDSQRANHQVEKMMTLYI